MSRNIKKIIVYAAVIIVFISVIFAIGIHSAERKFDKIRLENPSYGIGTATENISVKKHPLALSASAAKISAGDEVKIIASGKKWCKILVFSDTKVKEGYIKADKLAEEISTDTIFSDSLSISENEIYASVGESVEIKVSLSPVYSNEQPVWTSSNEEVAEVENGIVKVLKEGEAEITAKTAACTDTVKIKACTTPEKIEFTNTELIIDKGTKADLSNYITCEPEKSKISYYSSDESIAKVKDGKIIAVSEGTVSLTAVSGIKQTECRLTVRNISSTAKKPLNMPNIYGNIIDYHPSVYAFEDKWNGYKYWAAYTPYENCNDLYENPHLLASNDLFEWEEPKGFENPLEPCPPNYERGRVYNSDTELVYNTDTGLLECWWRFYDRPNMQVKLIRKTTSDGVHWSEKEDMVIGEMYKYDFLSPAIIYENGTYKMWSVNQNTDHSIDYRESKDGKNWSEIRKINVEYDDKKLAHWHLDVIHTPKGYEMDISAYYPEKNDRVHMDLYYSYSKDNTEYTKAQLLFSPSRGTNHWDNQGLYRSCLLYADKKYYLFYSGINTKKGPMGIGMVSGPNPFHMS